MYKDLARVEPVISCSGGGRGDRYATPQGVDVEITIFCEVYQFSAKIGLFLKNQ
jgi:hypothetical protein